MAHQVESMFYANAVPWHGLGTQVEECLTSHEAMVKAGLDWHVQKMGIYKGWTKTLVPGTDKESFNEFTVQDPDEVGFMVVRMDDHVNDTSGPKILGTVGKQYHPIQNHEAFAFMDSVVSDIVYETAGSLNGGRRVWMLASLKNRKVIRIGGSDEVEPYLLFTNTHDGSSSIRCMLTTVRVVCSNTLGMALAGGRQDGITIRHTSNAKERLKVAQDTLGIMDLNIQAFAHKANEYANKSILPADWFRVCNLLIPPVPDESTRSKENRSLLLSLLEKPTNAGPKRDTLWSAMNAVTDYSSHHMTVRGGAESRLDNTWFGRAPDFNAKAVGWLDMLLHGGELPPVKRVLVNA